MIEGGHGVVAVAEAVDDAGGDRDHVLERAGELDADHVLARVDAERARGERPLHGLGDGVLGARRPRPPSAARAPPRARTTGPESTASRAARRLGRRHLAHPLQRVDLEALRRGDEDGVRRRQRGAPRGRSPRQNSDGTTTSTTSASASASSSRRRGAQPGRQRRRPAGRAAFSLPLVHRRRRPPARGSTSAPAAPRARSGSRAPCPRRRRRRRSFSWRHSSGCAPRGARCRRGCAAGSSGAGRDERGGERGGEGDGAGAAPATPGPRGERERAGDRAERDVAAWPRRRRRRPRPGASAAQGSERREGAEAGGDALATLEAQPHRVHVADHGCDRGERGQRRVGRAGSARPGAPRGHPCRRRAGTRAHRPALPALRSTFVAPTLPLPTRRTSRTPKARATRKLNGTEPSRYAAASTAARVIMAASLPPGPARSARAACTKHPPAAARCGTA